MIVPSKASLVDEMRARSIFDPQTRELSDDHAMRVPTYTFLMKQL
jgi:hypothetical protein